MKLLMTCDAVGGVWQYATDLAAALAGEGVDVVLAVLGPPPVRHPRESGDPSPTPSPGREGGIANGDPSWAPAFAGVTVVETNLPLDWLSPDAATVRATADAVAELARDHGVDLVHLNSPTLAVARYPVPVIAVAHGCVGTWWAAAHGTAPDAGHAWHGELMRAGLLAADAVVAPTAAYAATLQSHYDLPAAPLAIHNGRALRSLPEAAPADHVLTAGRLWDRVKNTALLDAVAALIPVPLRAAGPVEAPHGERVAPTNLRLLGTLSDDALAAEYARAPIFVSAARFEPFGLAVLEAAQAGCPLVLSGIDTFRELWTGAALIVSDETPDAYAAAIERVRTEPGLRAHLSEAARLRAARYTPQATATAMLALYRSLLPADQLSRAA